MAPKRRDIYEIEDSDEERIITLKTTKPSIFGSLQSTNPSVNAPTVSSSLKMTGLPASYPKNSKPLTAFTCFPKLPIELRARIWDEAMPGPRVVQIFFSSFEYKGHDVDLFVSSNPTPASLHVNQESRQIAQKRYTLYFASCSDTMRQYKHTVYFDPKQDIAYMRSQKSFDPTYADLSPLSWLSFSHFSTKPYISKFLRRIALCVGFAADEHQCKNMVEILLDFPKLCEVLLIGDDETMDPDEDDYDEELSVRYLQRYEKKLELVDAGELIDESWNLSASRLVAELQRVYKTNQRKKVPQPNVTIKILRRTTKVIAESSKLH